MKTSDANYGNKKTGESIPSLKRDCAKARSPLAPRSDLRLCSRTLVHGYFPGFEVANERIDSYRYAP